MKHTTSTLLRVVFVMLMHCLLPWCGSGILKAQSGTHTVTGKVVDESGEPLIGVAVLIMGEKSGTVSDFDGAYRLEAPADKSLQFSYLGYQTQIIPVKGRKVIDVALEPESKNLNEVVVVGYGTTRKNDLTGSVQTVSAKDFNGGVSSPEQLINGKVAGVQIMSNSGSPTSGSTIRIRGGASLNASNAPLIVLDGVPLEADGISGNSDNFLNLINPNDIETMTVLKDASSTAIYGSRASNGVLMITTKKGDSEKLKLSVSSVQSIQTRTKTASMLSYEEFVNVVQTEGNGNQRSLLGTENTNWNDAIYQNAFGTDNNVSLTGRIVRNFPFRASVGYYNQEGILKSDRAERVTGNLNLNPAFFKDYLKFNLNVKGALNKNRFADASAIWNAATMNPTLGIYSGEDRFGGFTEAIDPSGIPVTRAVLNPLGVLEQRDSRSTVKRLVGNADADYKFHFLPELRIHGTFGYDYATGEGTVYVPAEAASAFTSNGRDYKYGPQEKTNKLFSAYLNYRKEFEKISSMLDVTGGYDYQYWRSNTPAYSEYNTLGEAQNVIGAIDQRHTLISFYGRANYSYDSKYLLTATIRRDGTSRFGSANRWGTFPSVAFGWRITQEEFMQEAEAVSNLKLRLSYGVTGQQEGIGNYGYLPVYTLSQPGAYYLFGDVYYPTYRPEAYVSNLKWETTKSYNAGFDFGFVNNRINGTVDYYSRKTKDLLATVPAAAGTNFDKTILTNVGKVSSHGVEMQLNGVLIDTKDVNWNVGVNATFQSVKITNLSIVEGAAITNTPAGPTVDNTYVQVLTEGFSPYMFYVYKQLYNEQGKPIEGAYADLNGDEVINSGDLYRYHSPAPDWLLGFNTQVRYKNWSLSTVLRASIGNYAYNAMAMNTGAFGTMSYNDYQLNNLSRSYLETGFRSRQHLSDYYVENASFLKMDNLSVGYDFGQIVKGARLRVSALIQNVFTITNYTGVDPELPNGFDSSFYPRPRTYSVNVSFEF